MCCMNHCDSVSFLYLPGVAEVWNQSLRGFLPFPPLALLQPPWEAQLRVVVTGDRGQWGREHWKQCPEEGENIPHFSFCAPLTVLYNWNLMKYALKSARAFQAEFYFAVPSMGSPSLHLQQLTLVTSSPGPMKNSGLPLAARQGPAALPLPQLRVLALAQQSCWHWSFPWHRVTVAPRPSCFPALLPSPNPSGVAGTAGNAEYCTRQDRPGAGSMCAPGETLAKGEDPRIVSRELRYVLYGGFSPYF